MVNQGKRNRGCRTCKARHVKCDETVPFCNRCKIAGRECPGVAKEGDWIFKNETKAVEERTVAVRARRREGSSSSETTIDLGSREATTPYEWDSTASTDNHEALWISSMLVPSKRDIALNHFIDRFMVASNPAPHSGPLLADMANVLPHTPSSSPIYSIIAALGFKILANYPELRSIRSDAALEYGKAVSTLSDNIQDPIKSKSDDTLLSVVLLIIYEMSDSWGKSTITFQNHNKGALAILRHRGLSQLDDPHSLHLFRAVRNHVIWNCIRTSTSLETFENDPFWYSDNASSGSPANRLTLLGFKLPYLRAQSKNLITLTSTLVTEQLARSYIADALSLEQSLQQWKDSLPALYQYENIPCHIELPDDMANAHFWPGVIHQYKTFFIAFMINRYRMMQLYAQNVILASAAHLPPQLRETLTSQAHPVVQHIVDEICASVPYHLNMTMTNNDNGSIQFGEEGAKSAALGAFYLLMPLTEAANQPGIPELQEKWLRGRLAFIVKAYGFAPG